MVVLLLRIIYATVNLHEKQLIPYNISIFQNTVSLSCDNGIRDTIIVDDLRCENRNCDKSRNSICLHENESIQAFYRRFKGVNHIGHACLERLHE